MRRILLVFMATCLLSACGDDGDGGGEVSKGGTPTDSGPAPLPEHDGGTDRKNWPPVVLRQAKEGHEPTPFSAKQIARACGPDSRRVFEMAPAGGEPTYTCWTFTDHTRKGATFHNTVCDKNGENEAERTSKAVTWEGLQSHASFPVDEVTTTETKVETPAGTFDCMLYTVKRTVRAGEGEDRYWFAWELPGPPVRMERNVNGKRTFTMTLVKAEHIGIK